jgi:hypothetical protein
MLRFAYPDAVSLVGISTYEKRGSQSDGGELFDSHHSSYFSQHFLFVLVTASSSSKNQSHSSNRIPYLRIHKVRTAIIMMSSSKELSIYQDRGTR